MGDESRSPMLKLVIQYSIGILTPNWCGFVSISWRCWYIYYLVCCIVNKYILATYWRCCRLAIYAWKFATFLESIHTDICYTIRDGYSCKRTATTESHRFNSGYTTGNIYICKIVTTRESRVFNSSYTVRNIDMCNKQTSIFVVCWSGFSYFKIFIYLCAK